MFGLFKRKDPAKRMKELTDVLNQTIRDFNNQNPDQRGLRAFVTSYDFRTRKPTKIILGHWSNGNFDVYYEGPDPK